MVKGAEGAEGAEGAGGEVFWLVGHKEDPEKKARNFIQKCYIM